MKFVHIADIHFDCPFSSLSVRENLSDNRRLEQRNVFKKVINYIKENEIKYLFISGDLYENEYVKKSTINYINDLFLEIPNTKIFISPGNHDPYLKNSYYYEFEFPSNVYIFKSNNFECKELSDINVYGMGFQDFYCKDINYSSINVIQNGKPNIMIMHASLGSGEENREYNPVLESKLNSLNMDYYALGHIHKPYYNIEKSQKIVYPGSLISLGFDEKGYHGMIVGEIDENRKLTYQFVKLDDTEFLSYEQNVEKLYSKEDLIEKINAIKLEKNKLYEIVLVGERNFEINTKEIFKLINNFNILKIKDNTKLKYNLEELKKEKTLRGLFIKELLKKREENIYSEKEINKAIEIGLNSLKE